MSFLGDLFLGSRSDPTLPGWAQQYSDDIRAAGDSAATKGRTWKAAKHDFKAGQEGRIEDMYRLQPVMHAINANKAASYDTASRMLGQNFAFEDHPEALTSAMLDEVSGQLDRNASNAFANAASGAYSDAERELDQRNDYADRARMDAAKAAAGAAQGFTYDRSRRGGLLQGLVQEWLSPKTIGSAVGL